MAPFARWSSLHARRLQLRPSVPRDVPAARRRSLVSRARSGWTPRGSPPAPRTWHDAAGR
eukprot:4088663-Pleurochrysis_carterae.AAC.7